ncbi:hypothetical protein SeMB42_g01912 [Synchytrium endobioticum]|uniref:Uncharacterized protein n=1 Tax=Synchytrium endobioticum TaxID=286115 RepID=A0A507DIQ0_9FUNG|nr:hypothetical protein SeMB42_g01912 [Synchytrium endobioticum]
MFELVTWSSSTHTNSLNSPSSSIQTCKHPSKHSKILGSKAITQAFWWLDLFRFLGEKEVDLPSGCWEKYDIASEKLGRMWEKHLPFDIETYLKEVDIKLEKSPA